MWRRTSGCSERAVLVGWSTGSGAYGHGGAYATSMNIDPQQDLITVFLVQHAGFAGEEGKAIQNAFRDAVYQSLHKRQP